MKLGDFLNSLAAKSGIPTNNQALIDLLSKSELANTELPDELANPINGNLMSLESAKNNPTLKHHFTALALNGFDSQILNSAKTFGIDDTADLEAEKNTYEKYSKLMAKLQSHTEKLKSAKGEGDAKSVEKYTREINELNQKLSSFSETHVPKSELDALKKSHDGELTTMLKRQFLSGKKYANDKLDAETNIEVAQTMLDRELASKGIVIVKDGISLKLKRASDVNLDYFDEQNRAVSFEGFADSFLAGKNLLAVSSPQQPSVQQQTIQTTAGNNAEYAAAIAASLSGLEGKTE